MTTIAILSISDDLGFLQEKFKQADPGLEVFVWPDPRCMQADIAVCWNPPPGIYPEMPRLMLVHSLAAGVDNVVANQDLRGLPVCRIVDPEQAEGMLQYVLWGVLYFHRRINEAMSSQSSLEWKRPLQVSASEFRVGIMGLGKIGSFVASRLASFGYCVSGWTRTPREIPGVTVYNGKSEYSAFLAGADLLVCLLPLTAQTRGILSRETFDALPSSTSLIHCGRGEHLVEADLIAALDTGQLRGALLDVFKQEPLPKSSPLWKNPRVVVTPHMATVPSFDTVVQQILQNVGHLREGRPLANVVDPEVGY